MIPPDKVTPGYWYAKWVKQKDHDEYCIVEVSKTNTLGLICYVTGNEEMFLLPDFIFLAPVPIWYN